MSAGVTYRFSSDGLTPDRLHGFFVGWPNPPSPETHLLLLQQSDYVVQAVDRQEKNVVGFITAIADHVLSAYIPFLEVLPECRLRGIGSELVHRMVKRLEGHYMIDLICDPHMQTFYAHIGFDYATGMMRRNYACQSGRVPS